ncbi:MAG: cation diffusion facilitator family transporter [Bacteroidetes bacterium]|nr:cation diffusion facilitator family transporter [Bacteroidota bacterium]
MAELSKRSAALASVGSGLLLTVLKVAVGLATGSLAIISEAAHSGLDLLAAMLTFFVVYVAEQPPDENHPYGHGKAESLGALAESALLVATALWVLWHAYERIFVSPEIPQVTIWSFLVMVVSVIVDYARARSLKRAAKTHRSQALAADAAHFTNDMLGSLVVILSLGVLEVATRTDIIPIWLALRADAIGAALVAAIALRVAYGLGRTSVRDLMEDVPGDLGRRLTAQVRTVEQLIPESVRIRVRFVGEQAFVDVAYQVPRSMSLEASHLVSQRVRDVIRRELPLADIVVSVEPARVEGEEYAATIYAIANRLGVAVHHLSLLLSADGLKVLLDLELPSDLTLGQAHITSEQLRESLQRELPETAEINIHLEARDLHVLPAVQQEDVARTIMQALDSLAGGSAVTRVTSYLVQHGTVLAVRCAYPPEMPLVDVHDRMASIEQQLRAFVPHVSRIHVDADPMA